MELLTSCRAVIPSVISEEKLAELVRRIAEEREVDEQDAGRRIRWLLSKHRVFVSAEEKMVRGVCIPPIFVEAEKVSSTNEDELYILTMIEEMIFSPGIQKPH